jgi:hypothetical protein
LRPTIRKKRREEEEEEEEEANDFPLSPFDLIGFRIRPIHIQGMHEVCEYPALSKHVIIYSFILFVRGKHFCLTSE